jgi:hypothetical protein
MQDDPTLVGCGDHFRAHEDALNCSEPKRVMDQEPGRIPSVGCLLYLAADQIIPQRPSISIARVPCKRVWVHSYDLSAMVLTATFLSLQESGHLSFRIHEGPSTNFPGGVITSLTLYTEVLDPALPPGLPGALLSAAIKSSDGRVGTAKGSLGLWGTDEAYVLDLIVSYPYVKYAVRGELAQVGASAKSWGAFRPDCARIASLAGVCADAVRWWKQQQTAAPRLCALLLAICRAASVPPDGVSLARVMGPPFRQGDGTN